MKQQIFTLLTWLLVLLSAPQKVHAQLVPKGELAPAPRSAQTLPPPRGQRSLKPKKPATTAPLPTQTPQQPTSQQKAKVVPPRVQPKPQKVKTTPSATPAPVKPQV